MTVEETREMLLEQERRNSTIMMSDYLKSSTATAIQSHRQG